jgi:hypothetical protein
MTKRIVRRCIDLTTASQSIFAVVKTTVSWRSEIVPREMADTVSLDKLFHFEEDKEDMEILT